MKNKVIVIAAIGYTNVIEFGGKPYVYPMPVLIVGAYDENGVPNISSDNVCNQEAFAWIKIHLRSI